MPDASGNEGTRQPSQLRLGSLNVILLLGRVTMDPDLRYTPKGTPVLGFRIAVDRVWRDRTTDEWKKEASFFSANAWGQLAERLGDTMKRGSAVLVEGELRSRSYEAKSGEKRSVVEIFARRVQVLDKFTAEPGAGPGAAPQEEEPEAPAEQLDDIPF